MSAQAVETQQVAAHRIARPALLVLPALGGLVLFGLSFRSIDLARVGDLGLLPALPPATYVALALLLLGFVATLQERRLQEPILALYVGALILVLHGTPTIAYGTLRYGWAWKHVGIVDYILRHGSVDPSIPILTAYHDWPGFFALAALYTHLAGFADAIGYATWAPLAFELAFAVAVVALLGTLTSNRRRVWLGVWLFASANWVGQDYFSPQAFAYFLYLVVLVVCLGWFRADGRRLPDVLVSLTRSWQLESAGRWLVRHGDADSVLHDRAGRGERAALAGLAIALATAIAASHQLTPLMLTIALGGLVLVDRLRLRALPVLAGVLAAAWAVLMGVGFLRGNLYWIAGSFGAPTSNAHSGLINLAAASHGQQLIARVDRALTLGVWLLGLLGLARRTRRGRADVAAAVLAVTPFALLAATSYGDEILLRVYLFSLPAFALLATGLFYPSRRPAWATALAQALLGAAVLAGMLVAYYGKEAQNYFPADEVRTVRALYRTAPAGSLLVDADSNYPWAFTHYEWYSYLSLDVLPAGQRRRVIARPAATILATARRQGLPCVYVVLTRSGTATVEMTGAMPRGSLEAVQRKLARAPAFQVLRRSPSAVVFGAALVPEAAACGLAP